jgi:hypothetical protein
MHPGLRHDWDDRSRYDVDPGKLANPQWLKMGVNLLGGSRHIPLWNGADG